MLENQGLLGIAFFEATAFILLVAIIGVVLMAGRREVRF